MEKVGKRKISRKTDPYLPIKRSMREMTFSTTGGKVGSGVFEGGDIVAEPSINRAIVFSIQSGIEPPVRVLFIG